MLKNRIVCYVIVIKNVFNETVTNKYKAEHNKYKHSKKKNVKYFFFDCISSNSVRNFTRKYSALVLVYSAQQIEDCNCRYA